MTSRFTFVVALACSATGVGVGGALGGAATGCSSDDSAPAAPQPAVPPVPPPPEMDASAPPPDAARPKVIPKPTFPEVMSRGGPVIKAPHVVPIVFAGDPMATQITEFTAKIAASTYWTDLGKEYGVGAMTVGATITIAADEPAPMMISSSAIETWLASKLSGATPAFGAPDAGTLYAVFYPKNTTIMMDGAGALGQSCSGYGGYHYEIAAGATQVGYAVLPRCSDIDELTVAASHEYYEWATDPFPKTKPAFSKLDDPHWAWQATMIGELGDLCTFLDRDNLRPTEIGFLVQREWSNKASLAGKYPCAPAKNTPYFQAIPTSIDDAIVPDYGTISKYVKTKAVRVKPGTSRTVDVLIYSDQAGNPLVPLRAMSYDELYNKNKPSAWTYSLDRSYAKVGESVELTIKAPAADGYDLVMMLAYTSDTAVDYWPILVVNDDGSNVGIGRPTITPDMLPKKATTLGMRRALRQRREPLLR